MISAVFYQSFSVKFAPKSFSKFPVKSATFPCALQGFWQVAEKRQNSRDFQKHMIFPDCQSLLVKFSYYAETCSTLTLIHSHWKVQCSSDISKLYTHVFCVYAYVKTRTYTYICRFVIHSHKYLRMKHCWSNEA